MAARKKQEDTGTPRRPPATTLEARENQLISLAVDAAEEQIRSGNASSQLLTHFLKLGTVREQLEREKIQNENLLAKAKIEAMASGKRVEELYESALNAMRSYAGHEVDQREEDY